MPISNAPFFKYAFAQSGDKTTIPQDQDPLYLISNLGIISSNLI